MSKWDVFITSGEPQRVCFRVDHQYFYLSAEAEEDEPDYLHFYGRALIKAMEKISPGNQEETKGHYSNPIRVKQQD